MRTHISVGEELGYPANMEPLPWLKGEDALARGEHDEALRHVLAGWKHLLDEESAQAVRTIYAALGGRGSRTEAISGLEQLVDKAAAEKWIGRYFGFSAYLLEWSLLLEERRLAHAVTDLVVASFDATGGLIFQPRFASGRQAADSYGRIRISMTSSAGSASNPIGKSSARRTFDAPRRFSRRRSPTHEAPGSRRHR